MVGACSKTGPSRRVLHKNHKTRLAVAARLPPLAQKGINSTVRSSFKRLKGNTVGEIPDEEDGRWCCAACRGAVRCPGAVAPARRRLRRPRRRRELDLQQRRSQSHSTGRPFGSGTVSSNSNASCNTGYVLGGQLGYDFVGPRIEAEGAYRRTHGTLAVRWRRLQRWLQLPAKSTSWATSTTTSSPDGAIVPYVGAGARCRVPQRGRSRQTR